MKLKRLDDFQSGFWFKLIGTLTSVGIVVVLIFGGIQNVVEQISDLQNELDLTSDALDKKARQLEQANNDLLETSATLQDTQSALSATSAKLDVAYRDLTDAKAELDSSQLQLAQATRERDETAAALDKTQSDMADTLEELEHLQAELDLKTGTIDDLESDVATARLELEQKTDELIAAEIEIEDQRLKLEQVTAELAEFQLKEYRVRSALRKAEAQLDAANREGTVAKIYAAQYQLEALTHISTQAYASCIVEEYVSLANYYYDQGQTFSADQIARFERYLEELAPDGSYNPVSLYCGALRDFYGGYLNEDFLEEAARVQLVHEAGMTAAKARVELGKFIRQTKADNEAAHQSDRPALIWQEILPRVSERIIQLLGADLAERSVKLEGDVLYLLIGSQ